MLDESSFTSRVSEILGGRQRGRCSSWSTGPLAWRGSVRHGFAIPTPLPIKKGVLLEMLPEKLSYPDRFKMARDLGFEVVQAPTEGDEHKAEEIKKAADGAGIRIDSVMNMDHWKYPLSSSNPADVEKSLAGMRTSLHNAKLWGADTVLLVPAVVDSKTSYQDAWVRSKKEIQKLMPLAEELKVVIAIEEVWNKFLLSPLEMGSTSMNLRVPGLRPGSMWETWCSMVIRRTGFIRSASGL